MQATKLQRLCGEYMLLKHAMLAKKLEVITEAGKKGVLNHILIQMEW